MVFITVCLLLFGFFLLWGLLLAEDKDAVSMGLAAAGVIGLLCLPVYATYFLRKAKRINL